MATVQVAPDPPPHQPPPPPAPAGGQARGKRHQVVVACDRCRNRKTKCDGRRPVCTPCSQRGRGSECRWSADPDANPMTALKRKYDQLNENMNVMQQFTKLLKTSSNGEAQRMLASFRQGSDVGALLQTTHDITSLVSALPMRPERRMSLDENTMALTRDRTTTATLPAAAPPLPAMMPSPTPPLVASTAQEVIDRLTSVKVDSAPNFHPTANSPRPESRLAQVSITAQWKITYVNDEDFRTMLQLFFTWDHPTLLLFDKDIFLDDLVAGIETDFCNPIIIHTVILLSTKTFAHVDRGKAESIEHYAVHYLEGRGMPSPEAQTVATILSCIAMFLYHSWRAQDVLGYRYLANAYFISDLMGLYRPHLRHQVYRDDPQAKRQTAGFKAVAWGQFNLRAFLSLIYDILPIAFPPPAQVSTIRDEDGKQVSTAKDLDSWQAWPYDDTYRPSHEDSLSYNRCELAQIVKDIMPLHRRFEDSPLCEIYQENAHHVYYRLLIWFNNLGLRMKEDSELEHASPQLLNLHNRYYLAISELFRPFVVPPERLSPTAAALLQAGLRVDLALPAYISAYEALRTNLVRFGDQYIPHCPISPNDIASIIYLCVDTLPHLSHDATARAYLLLGAKLCKRMAKHYSLYGFILQAFKIIAAQHEYILPDEVESIVTEAMTQAPLHTNLDRVQSCLQIAACMRYRDSNEASLERIMKRTNIAATDTPAMQLSDG